MRILHICAYTWAIGGPARTIYDYTQAALEAGFSVDILSPMSPYDKLYPAPPGSRVIPCLRTPGISRFFREFSTELYQYLTKHITEYDLIHCHGIWHFGSLAPFLLNKSVPKLVTIHGLLDPWALRQGYWKKRVLSVLLQKRLLQRADLIHVLNEQEKQDVALYLGQSRPNVVVIPNGVSVDEFARLPAKGSFRQQFNLSPDGKLVLFMSRLNVKKGLDLLLPAFARYAQQHDDAILILAGPDDGYRELAEAFIQQQQLAHRIKVVGMLTGETKRAALNDADLFVLPSYSEGFSIAVLEAMAAGVASLLSDRVGFGDMIKTYDAAYLADLTVDGVASGLDKLLSDPTYRKIISQNAHRLVSEQYDSRMVAKQLIDAYRSLSVNPRV